MKIAVIMLVIICGYLLGNIYALRLKKRQVFLSKLIMMLESFNQLITYKDMNVDELIDWAILSGEYNEIIILNSIKKTKGSFEYRWRTACEDKALREFLTESDINELISIGKGIGKSDKSGQNAHFSLHCQFLRKKESEAYKDETVKGRLYRKIGLLCGVAVGIMLL